MTPLADGYSNVRSIRIQTGVGLLYLFPRLWKKCLRNYYNRLVSRTTLFCLHAFGENDYGIIITGWSLVIVIGGAFLFFMMYIQMEGPY